MLLGDLPLSSSKFFFRIFGLPVNYLYPLHRKLGIFSAQLSQEWHKTETENDKVDNKLPLSGEFHLYHICQAQLEMPGIPGFGETVR